MKTKISIYGHYGSRNHGNEAIVRGFKEIFKLEKIILYSYQPDTDYLFQLNEIVDVRKFIEIYGKYSAKRIIRGILNRILRNKQIVYMNDIKSFIKDIDGIYMIEAGDQYCEGNELRQFYYYVNDTINELGGKTVMMPASIDISLLNDKKLINDLNNYAIVYARESITYNALNNCGLKSNIKFLPDTAFKMISTPCVIPKLFEDRRILGITVGSLSQGKEEYYQNMIKSIEELIKYIVEFTEYGVALIPHVNVGTNLNDIDTLNEMYNKFLYTGRIVLIPEQRADKQKYVIGKCDFIITLRTHVSVAAYSQAIPTLVLGYSQKSKGIATDLFGTDENYVIRVEELEKSKLINSFKWLVNNEERIKKIYNLKLDNYISKIDSIYSDLINLGEEYVE